MKKIRISSFHLVVLLILIAGCATSSSSSRSPAYTKSETSKFKFEPSITDPRIPEVFKYVSGKHQHRGGFENARSYALKELRTKNSPVALETLVHYILNRASLSDSLAYEAARDLYLYDSKTYKSLFAHVSYLRTVSKSRQEGEEILPLRREAAGYAYDLNSSGDKKEKIIAFLREDPRTASTGYVVAKRSGNDKLAVEFLNKALEGSPVFAAGIIAAAGLNPDVVGKKDLTKPVNRFSYGFFDDFRDNRHKWSEKEADGIFKKVRDGALYFGNNRKPGGKYARMSYAADPYFLAWRYYRFDFTDLSENPESTEYWLYYGNIGIHVRGDRGYRIFSNPGHKYYDYLTLQDWRPLPEDCSPGKTWTFGIYPGDDEIFFQMGKSIISLPGAVGKRANPLYVDINPGVNVRFDNFGWYEMEAPSINLQAEPKAVEAAFRAYGDNLTGDDILPWLEEPFLRAYFVEDLIARNMDWKSYQLKMLSRLDFNGFERFARQAPAIPSLSESEKVESLRTAIDKRFNAFWTKKGRAPKSDDFIPFFNFLYSRNDTFDTLLTSEGAPFETSYAQRRFFHDYYTKGEKRGKYRKEFTDYLEDLLDLTVNDLQANWDYLKKAEDTNRQTQFAMSLYSSEKAPFLVRNTPFYEEHFSGKTNWPIHAMKNKSDYLLKVQDDYPATGYLMANGDNGDDKRTYFYVYMPLNPDRKNSFLSKYNEEDVDLMDLSLVDASPESAKDSSLFIRYNGLIIELSDSNKFKLSLRGKKGDLAVLRDWTEFDSRSRRIRISLYADRVNPVLIINGQRWEAEKRALLIRDPNDMGVLRFDVAEGSAFAVNYIAARDAELVSEQFLDEIQETAFRNLTDPSKKWRLLAENYYRNRAVYDQMKKGLFDRQQERLNILPYFVDQDEFRVLEHLYDDNEKSFMIETADYVRTKLNTYFDNLSEDKDYLSSFLLNLYSPYRDGYYFYNEATIGLARSVLTTKIPFNSTIEERTSRIKKEIRSRGKYPESHPWAFDKNYLINLCGLAEVINQP